MASPQQYKYIRGFVKRWRNKGCLSYKCEFEEGKTIIRPTNIDSVLHEELKKLQEILAKDGFEFDEDEIESIVSRENERQEYELFKSRILQNETLKPEALARNVVDIYGENSLNYTLFLKRLLEERKIHWEVGRVRELIEEEKRTLELERFRKDIGNESQEGISIQKIDSMSGSEFEEFLEILFEKMGFKVERTKLSGDQGADLIISKLGERVVVQAKRLKGKVSNKAVQEVAAAIKFYSADRGMVVTNAAYTSSAVQLAEANNIELIDRYKLVLLINQYFR